MSKIITQEEFLNKAKANNTKVDVIGNYQGCKNKIDCRCKFCGEIFEMNPYDICINKGHRSCSNKMASKNRVKTQSDFIQEVSQINPDIEITGNYINAYTTITYICKKHNVECNGSPTHILSGKTGCLKCIAEKRTKVRKSHEKFVTEIKAINSNIEILSEYQTSQDKIAVKCLKCGFIWEPVAGSLMSGCGCPKCVGRHKTTDEFVNEIQNYNDKIEIIGEYIDSQHKVKCKCKKCFYEWYAMPNNLKITGCPKCRMSHGERKIFNILTKMNIPFETQKKYDDLIGLKGHKLSYDFYLPDHNILIEYQGQYHDGTVITRKQTSQEYSRQKERDSMKREYAKSHNIELLEIWYWDYPNIEQIINDVVCA